MNRHCVQLQRFRRASESGQAAVETALVILVLLALLGGVMAIGPLIYTHLAVLTAANDCATAAAQTLDPGQGHFQGVSAAQETLASFRVRQGAAAITVSGVWTRGSPVTCRIGYEVDLSGIPMAASFNLPTDIEYTVSLPAQAYKSTWK